MTLDHASGSVLDEPSPGPLSPPPPSPSRSLFGFGSLPETEEGTGSLPPTPDGPGSDSGTEWLSDELPDESGPEDSDPTSSPGSSRADKPAALLSQAQMRATARQAVKIGTGMAHTVGAKTEAQQAVGLYLADDDDAANIGNPLADIMHRRGDILDGKLSPDANDFLKSLMGVAGYLTKQFQKIAYVRQVEAPAQSAEVRQFPEAAA